MAFIRRSLGFVADHANPILVKEIRQGTRSKLFLAVFGLLLVAAMLMSIFISPTEPGDRPTGPKLFYSLAACLGIVTLIIAPWLAFRAMTVEREQNTWDILAVSGLGPNRIVNGKLWGSVLQLLVFFSALAPFMAFSFLLRGIDIVMVMTALGWMFLYGLLAVTFALFLGTQARTARTAILLQIIMLFGGFFVVTWASSIMFAVMFGSRLSVGSAFGASGVPWSVNLMLLAQVLAWSFFFHSLAVSSLQFDAANRATRPRLALLALIGVAYLTPICTYVVTHAWDWESLAACSVVIAILIYLAGLLGVTDNAGLSRRLRKQMPTSLPGQIIAALLWPGPGRSWLFLLLALSLGCFLPAMLLDDLDQHKVALWAGLYVWIYLSLSHGVVRLIELRKPGGRVGRRVGVLAITALMLCAPPIIQMLVAMGGPWKGPAGLAVFNPVMAALDHYNEKEINALLAVLSLLGLAIHLPAIARDLREQAVCRGERRAERQSANAEAAAA